MTNAIGNWNPAWGPRPEWVGNVKQKTYPKSKPLLLRCPNGCTKDDVVVHAPPQQYFCSTCEAEMDVARIVKERAPVEPAVKPGERYGRLVVQQVISAGKRGAKAWCLCDCGQTKAVAGHHLRSGATKSCGCLRREGQDHPWRRNYK